MRRERVGDTLVLQRTGDDVSLRQALPLSAIRSAMMPSASTPGQSTSLCSRTFRISGMSSWSCVRSTTFHRGQSGSANPGGPTSECGKTTT